jgi:hypothetical protein
MTAAVGFGIISIPFIGLRVEGLAGTAGTVAAKAAAESAVRTRGVTVARPSVARHRHAPEHAVGRSRTPSNELQWPRASDAPSPRGESPMPEQSVDVEGFCAFNRHGMEGAHSFISPGGTAAAADKAIARPRFTAASSLRGLRSTLPVALLSRP